jgi:hypothetical protein
MRKLFALLIGIVMMGMAVAAQAATPAVSIDGNRIYIDASALPPDLIAKLKEAKDNADVSAQVQSAINAAPPREALKDYAEIGAQVGKALGEAAKSVGIAVNEFAQTKVGVMASALIVYKVIGQDVVYMIKGFFHVLIGTSLLILALRLWSKFYWRAVVVRSETVTTDANGKEVRQIEYYDPAKMDSNARDFIFW